MMKRSMVNQIMREADAFIRSFGFLLPPFAYWIAERVPPAQAERRASSRNRLGWDITDYGQGHFDKLGLFLFTVRNGNARDLGAAAACSMPRRS